MGCCLAEFPCIKIEVELFTIFHHLTLSGQAKLSIASCMILIWKETITISKIPGTSLTLGGDLCEKSSAYQTSRLTLVASKTTMKGGAVESDHLPEG